MNRRMGVVVAVVGVFLAGASCNGVDPPPSTRIAVFESSATTVERGETITLSWQVVNPGSAAGAFPCSIARHAQGQAAEEAVPVACSSSLTEVPPVPASSGAITYQLNALKRPFVANDPDPYLTDSIVITIVDPVPPAEPDPFDVEVTAGDSFFDPPVGNIEVPAGATTTIKVNIPTQLRGSGQRVTVEASTDSDFLDLVLYTDDDDAPYASTSGSAYFRPGLAGLREGFLQPALSTQSVDVVLNCAGPCIATPAPVGQAYVVATLTNVGPSPAVVPLYTYVEPLIDTSEPDNDLLDGAPVISLSSVPFRGAIELLGDHDFVWFADSGNVQFDERLGYDVDLVMDLFEVDGHIWTTIRPGDSRFVFANEYGRVRSDPLAPRASAFGYYTVGYEED